MIKSMTGYGRKTDTAEGYQITFEIRSVNNRYLDTNLRLPRVYGYLEERIKNAIQKVASRGKVDAFLSVEKFSGEESEIVLDEGLVAQYVAALRKIAHDNGLRDDISVSCVSRFPDIFAKKAKPEDEEAVWQKVEPVVNAALDDFLAMRRREGENLFRDLDARLDTLEEILAKIREKSAGALAVHREKLEARLREYLAEVPLDESRLLTEVGILADKVDTGEEITRLASHLSQYRKLIRQDTPSGRTMDFLTQELNREVNTIGSKCNLLEITELVIAAKNEIERIREQIQNIE